MIKSARKAARQPSQNEQLCQFGERMPRLRTREYQNRYGHRDATMYSWLIDTAFALQS